MTDKELRDWFAGKALTVVLDRMPNVLQTLALALVNPTSYMEEVEHMAKSAYLMADVMMEAREKR